MNTTLKEQIAAESQKNDAASTIAAVKWTQSNLQNENAKQNLGRKTS